MINEKDFQRIKKELILFDKEREELIKKSRAILKSSKQAIYLVHRNEFNDAENMLNKVEKEIKLIKKTIKCNPKLDFLGAYSVANQEYVEAKCYLEFVKNRKIPTCAKLNVQVEDYLLGLCDLTGELGRRAVASVIKKEFDNVYLIHDVVDQIYGLFLQLDLRNGELRKKSDAIKWNLKKIEGIIYDIKIKSMDK
jgi:translin